MDRAELRLCLYVCVCLCVPLPTRRRQIVNLNEMLNQYRNAQKVGKCNETESGSSRNMRDVNERKSKRKSRMEQLLIIAKGTTWQQYKAVCVCVCVCGGAAFIHMAKWPTGPESKSLWLNYRAMANEHVVCYRRRSTSTST